jgi:hypothetical protein
VVVLAGRFPDSASQAPGKFAFVHLDADLFEPTTAGLEFFYFGDVEWRDNRRARL